LPPTAPISVCGRATETVVRPAELPHDAAGFVGRASELDRLGARATARVHVISGTAGVGKPALAVRWPHRVADEYPDGQLYVDLHGFDPHREPLAAARADPAAPQPRSRRPGPA
jgi:hypothetical protein